MMNILDILVYRSKEINFVWRKNLFVLFKANESTTPNKLNSFRQLMNFGKIVNQSQCVSFWPCWICTPQIFNHQREMLHTSNKWTTNCSSQCIRLLFLILTSILVTLYSEFKLMKLYTPPSTFRNMTAGNLSCVDIKVIGHIWMSVG